MLLPVPLIPVGHQGHLLFSIEKPVKAPFFAHCHVLLTIQVRDFPKIVPINNQFLKDLKALVLNMFPYFSRSLNTRSLLRECVSIKD